MKDFNLLVQLRMQKKIWGGNLQRERGKGKGGKGGKGGRGGKGKGVVLVRVQ